MGCNCGGQTKKESTQNFVYTGTDGRQTVYTSQVQAKAAVIRNKGGTWVAVPR
jgi:hypothetical protein